MSVLSVQESNFNQEVLQSPLPVLIDFWAPWCNPCRMFSPIVDQFAERVAGRVKVVKINVDEAPSLAQKFGVMSIPTVAVVQDGKVTAKAVGMQSQQQLAQMLGL